jgi:Domain of unknown function (DUF4439)
VSEIEPLQTTLAAEHAAVFVYGVLGGRTSRSATPDLFDAVASAYAAHRARRDQLIREITDLGGTAVAAEAAYATPLPLDTADQVARAALEVERSSAATYSWLVANTAGANRRRAIAALDEAAVRELVFRGTPEMFPGANEYADR